MRVGAQICCWGRAVKGCSCGESERRNNTLCSYICRVMLSISYTTSGQLYKLKIDETTAEPYHATAVRTVVVAKGCLQCTPPPSPPPLLHALLELRECTTRLATLLFAMPQRTFVHEIHSHTVAVGYLPLGRSMAAGPASQHHLVNVGTSGRFSTVWLLYSILRRVCVVGMYAVHGLWYRPSPSAVPCHYLEAGTLHQAILS